MESGAVMVAVSTHPSSVSALKWALSNRLVAEGGTIKLVHVRPPVRSIPTPLGNYVPLEQVSPEIVAAYMRDIQWESERNLQGHQNLCDTFKVKAEFVRVESDIVSKAILEQISRLCIKKFIIGTSTRKTFTWKFTSPSIPEYVAKHAAEFCTVFVVSKGRLVSVKEANCVSSPAILNITAESQPTCCNFDGKCQNVLKTSVMVHGDIKGFMPQPLPIQRQKAASTISLMHGWSKSGSAQTHSFISVPKGSQIFVSSFWFSNLPLKTGFSTVPQENSNITWRADVIEENRHKPSFQEAKSVGTGDLSNDIDTLRCSNGRDQEFSQGLSAAEQINRMFENLDEDRQMVEMLLKSCVDRNNGSIEERNHDDQCIAEDDMAKLKVELEVVWQRIQNAEKAAAIAAEKSKGSDACAKEEAKRQEKALSVAELARKKAVEEANKFDEALMAIKAAKLAAAKEAQRRREAEDRARQESLIRHETMAALLKAKRKYREYSYESLKFATDSFSKGNQIGEGGYGAVYRGKLHHMTVAIKVLRESGAQSSREFEQEVQLLGHIHHPHLVLLLGACTEKGCLVYEYLANGSLEDRLFCKGDTPPLPWYTRVRIAAEVATGLLYLHASRPNPIVHRDLKPANILLDQNYVSKIGDVGLARLVPGAISYSITEYRDTNPVGTFAYIDPEYQRTGVFCPRSDVYALGLIMLQLLTGRGAIGVTKIAEIALEENALNEVLDLRAGSWPIDEAKQMAQLALECTEFKRKNRPDLETHVLPVLEKLRAFAEEFAAQVWRKQTIFQSGQAVPGFFLCPIFKEVMEDPHIAADGFTYEYGAIKHWLQDHNSSPMTNLKLSHKYLTPNHSLRSAIHEWRQRVLCA